MLGISSFEDNLVSGNILDNIMGRKLDMIEDDQRIENDGDVFDENWNLVWFCMSRNKRRKEVYRRKLEPGEYLVEGFLDAGREAKIMFHVRGVTNFNGTVRKGIRLRGTFVLLDHQELILEIVPSFSLCSINCYRMDPNFYTTEEEEEVHRNNIRLKRGEMINLLTDSKFCELSCHKRKGYVDLMRFRQKSNEDYYISSESRWISINFHHPSFVKDVQILLRRENLKEYTYEVEIRKVCGDFSTLFEKRTRKEPMDTIPVNQEGVRGIRIRCIRTRSTDELKIVKIVVNGIPRETYMYEELPEIPSKLLEEQSKMITNLLGDPMNTTIECEKKKNDLRVRFCIEPDNKHVISGENIVVNFSSKVFLDRLECWFFDEDKGMVYSINVIAETNNNQPSVPKKKKNSNDNPSIIIKNNDIRSFLRLWIRKGGITKLRITGGNTRNLFVHIKHFKIWGYFEKDVLPKETIKKKKKKKTKTKTKKKD